MEQLTDNLKHLPQVIGVWIVGAFAGTLTFFGKRTLNNYDRRIAKAEQNDEKILESLKKIEIKLARMDTTLKERLH